MTKNIESELAEFVWNQRPRIAASWTNRRKVELRRRLVWFVLGYGCCLLSIAALILWEVWSK